MTTRCGLCAAFGHGLFIALHRLDRAANWLLLGDPGETVSARTARARRAGRQWAGWFCRLLTWGAWAVTLGHAKEDHCDYDIDSHLAPAGSRERWDWNTGRWRARPVTTSEDAELPPAAQQAT